MEATDALEQLLITGILRGWHLEGVLRIPRWLQVLLGMGVRGLLRLLSSSSKS